MSTSIPGVSPAGQPPPIMVSVTSASSITDYSKIVPTNVLGLLGAIQLIIAAIAITSQIITMIHYDAFPLALIGTGIWSGFLFGLSGVFAMWAGVRPSLCSIITCMVFSIIAASICVPLIVLDSFSIALNVQPLGVPDFPRGRPEYYETNVAMYSIQVIIGLVQACIAIGCSAMTCKATCCRQIEAGSVSYAPNAALNANVQHIQMGQVHPGGVFTIPINQNTRGILPETVNMAASAELTNETLENRQSPPPQYEDDDNSSIDDALANALNYQRFA